jgi:hypothetical protein
MKIVSKSKFFLQKLQILRKLGDDEGPNAEPCRDTHHDFDNDENGDAGGGDKNDSQNDKNDSQNDKNDSQNDKSESEGDDVHATPAGSASAAFHSSKGLQLSVPSQKPTTEASSEVEKRVLEIESTDSQLSGEESFMQRRRRKLAQRRLTAKNLGRTLPISEFTKFDVNDPRSSILDIDPVSRRMSSEFALKSILDSSRCSQSSDKQIAAAVVKDAIDSSSDDGALKASKKRSEESKSSKVSSEATVQKTGIGAIWQNESLESSALGSEARAMMGKMDRRMSNPQEDEIARMMALQDSAVKPTVESNAARASMELDHANVKQALESYNSPQSEGKEQTKKHTEFEIKLAEMLETDSEEERQRLDSVKSDWSISSREEDVLGADENGSDSQTDSKKKSKSKSKKKGDSLSDDSSESETEKESAAKKKKATKESSSDETDSDQSVSDASEKKPIKKPSEDTKEAPAPSQEPEKHAKTAEQIRAEQEAEAERMYAQMTQAASLKPTAEGNIQRAKEEAAAKKKAAEAAAGESSSQKEDDDSDKESETDSNSGSLCDDGSDGSKQVELEIDSAVDDGNDPYNLAPDLVAEKRRDSCSLIEHAYSDPERVKSSDEDSASDDDDDSDKDSDASSGSFTPTDNDDEDEEAEGESEPEIKVNSKQKVEKVDADVVVAKSDAPAKCEQELMLERVMEAQENAGKLSVDEKIVKKDAKAAIEQNPSLESEALGSEARAMINKMDENISGEKSKDADKDGGSDAGGFVVADVGPSEAEESEDDDESSSDSDSKSSKSKSSLDSDAKAEKFIDGDKFALATEEGAVQRHAFSDDEHPKDKGDEEDGSGDADDESSKSFTSESSKKSKSTSSKASFKSSKSSNKSEALVTQEVKKTSDVIDEAAVEDAADFPAPIADQLSVLSSSSSSEFSAEAIAMPAPPQDATASENVVPGAQEERCWPDQSEPNRSQNKNVKQKQFWVKPKHAIPPSVFLPKLVGRPELWPSKEYIEIHLQQFVRDRHVPLRSPVRSRTANQSPSASKRGLKGKGKGGGQGPRARAMQRRMNYVSNVEEYNSEEFKLDERPEWRKHTENLRTDGLFNDPGVCRFDLDNFNPFEKMLLEEELCQVTSLKELESAKKLKEGAQKTLRNVLKLQGRLSRAVRDKEYQEQVAEYRRQSLRAELQEEAEAAERAAKEASVAMLKHVQTPTPPPKEPKASEAQKQTEKDTQMSHDEDESSEKERSSESETDSLEYDTGSSDDDGSGSEKEEQEEQEEQKSEEQSYSYEDEYYDDDESFLRVHTTIDRALLANPRWTSHAALEAERRQVAERRLDYAWSLQNPNENEYYDEADIYDVPKKDLIVRTGYPEEYFKKNKPEFLQKHYCIWDENAKNYQMLHRYGRVLSVHKKPWVPTPGKQYHPRQRPMSFEFWRIKQQVQVEEDDDDAVSSCSASSVSSATASCLESLGGSSLGSVEKVQKPQAPDPAAHAPARRGPLLDRRMHDSMFYSNFHANLKRVFILSFASKFSFNERVNEKL